jgi:prepilin-type processing-associated H-X9-DG protein
MYMTDVSAAAGISWCPDHARTDTNTVDIRSGVLFQYNTSVAIYHCPADRSTVETQDGQKLSQLRNRSYNMSQSLNGYPDFLTWPLTELPFYKKLTDIRQPAPARIFVFIDEHPDTLLDAQFGNPVGLPLWQPMWFDLPADRHNQGGNLSFADGHVERWRWNAPMTFRYGGQSPANPAEQSDFDRVQGAMKTVNDN